MGLGLTDILAFLNASSAVLAVDVVSIMLQLSRCFQIGFALFTAPVVLSIVSPTIVLSIYANATIVVNVVSDGWKQ